MSQQTINVGNVPNDGSGDTLRAAMIKVNANFAELYNIPTRLVNSNNTSTSTSDHYVGVNYAGVVNIALHTPSENGQRLIIKDESGLASVNPIIVSGSVDNSSAFTLAINNGSVTLVYRNGWRII